MGEDSAASNAGHSKDMGLILGLGRSPGEENGNQLQYSCLENSINRGACQATVLGVAKFPYIHTHGQLCWLIS